MQVSDVTKEERIRTPIGERGEWGGGWRHRMGIQGTWGGFMERMRHRAREKDIRGMGLEEEAIEQRVGDKKDRMGEDRHME